MKTNFFFQEGANIAVKHRLGSKYWIKTEPCTKKQTSKIIILQQEDTQNMYFFFTGNSWKFKSIPFTLKPCSQYRCMTCYGTTYHTEDLPLSFKCKSTPDANFSNNYHLFKTSKINSFTACKFLYMHLSFRQQVLT